MILDKVKRTLADSKSIIAFETEGSISWEKWDRYITIEGKKAYHIGNICNTCAFFFERMDGANQSINPEKVIESLNSGIQKLEKDFIDQLQEIFPNGEYLVLLSRIKPTLVKPGDTNDYFSHEEIEAWGIDGFWGMPHFPKTEYYRLHTERFSEEQILFEFLIPMFPSNWLDKERLQEYTKLLESGGEPTAVSLSVLDIKQYFDSKDKHFCLAHYLVDGHHKVYAAAKNNSSLTLVSFLAIEKGISSIEEIENLLQQTKSKK